MLFPILHFRKQLVAPPVATIAAGIHVRHLTVPNDTPAWLALRERAMAGQVPDVRNWTRADFRREFVEKDWWNELHAWAAVDGDAGDNSQAVIGSVILGLREGAGGAVPVVHWLLVDPAFRRRGVGRVLMSHLEQAAWDAGWREVQLETHAGWKDAVAFYQSMGYAPLRERSPR
jgi:GNAT superfamily N-acetyltransferase